MAIDYAPKSKNEIGMLQLELENVYHNVNGHLVINERIIWVFGDCMFRCLDCYMHYGRVL